MLVLVTRLHVLSVNSSAWRGNWNKGYKYSAPHVLSAISNAYGFSLELWRGENQPARAGSDRSPPI
jgi:hypothetical protein